MSGNMICGQKFCITKLKLVLQKASEMTSTVTGRDHNAEKVSSDSDPKCVVWWKLLINQSQRKTFLGQIVGKPKSKEILSLKLE